MQLDNNKKLIQHCQNELLQHSLGQKSLPNYATALKTMLQ